MDAREGAASEAVQVIDSILANFFPGKFSSAGKSSDLHSAKWFLERETGVALQCHLPLSLCLLPVEGCWVLELLCLQSQQWHLQRQWPQLRLLRLQVMHRPGHPFPPLHI